MRVLVCGGRNFRDRSMVDHALESLEPRPTLVITGCASGADAYAMNWAGNTGVACSVYFAAWKKLGRAAGPVRNRDMLLYGKPQIVLAFPGGAGTTSMVNLAEKAGVEVRKVGW